MALTELSGIVKFKIEGQAAVPQWQRTLMKKAIDNAEVPPEALRFQCRIATDAQTNFALIKLANGETLTLHYKARPQFGKNRAGHAYLTATMTYSGDGQNYRIQWVGDAVPPKMQEVAVKHDKGLAVKPVTVALDLSKAQITPSWKANYHPEPRKPGQSTQEKAAAAAARAAGKPQRVHAARNCRRLTEADLAPVTHGLY